MKKHKWTRHEEQYLINHYDNGNGVARCADYLGISTNAVKKKAQRLGTTGERRNFTEAEIEFIKANYGQLGYTQIANILGVKRSSVNTLVVKRLHLRLNPGVRGIITARTNKEWKRTEATKRKISQKAKLRTKAANSNWKGGISPIRIITRRFLWDSWILPIMQRDGFVCQDCGCEGVVMNVHHILPYAKIQREAIEQNPGYDPQNFEDKIKIAKLIASNHELEHGITLCVSCHKKRHSAKRGELRGTLTILDAGNPQPSRSNVISFVGRKVQRLTGEESQTNKPDTSAPNTFIAGVMR